MVSMGSSYERLFGVLPIESCDTYLCERVLDRIYQQRARLVRARLVLSSLSGIGSVVFIVWTGVLFMHEAMLSGFSAYASLLISDSAVVEGHGVAYALLLLESLPILATGLTLVAAAALLASIRSIVRAVPKRTMHTTPVLMRRTA